MSGSAGTRKTTGKTGKVAGAKTTAAKAPESLGRLRLEEPEGMPSFIRLHHLVHGHEETSPAQIARWLGEVNRATSRFPELPILAGGLARFVVDDVADDTEYDDCMAAARAWLAELKEEIAGELDRHVLFGLDVLLRDRRGETYGPVQLAVHYAPKSGRVRIVGAKQYPVPAEASYVYTDHVALPCVVQIPKLGRVLPLVCHDMNVYNGRGRATTKDQWRKDLRKRVEKLVREAKPDVVFNSIHRLPSDRTFSSSYSAFEQEVEGGQVVGAFGWNADVSTDDVVAVARRLTRGATQGIEVLPW